jgi:hypothetical protein
MSTSSIAIPLFSVRKDEASPLKKLGVDGKDKHVNTSWLNVWADIRKGFSLPD